MAVIVQVFYTVTSVSANYVLAQFYTELWLAYLPLPCALLLESSGCKGCETEITAKSSHRSRRRNDIVTVAVAHTFSRLILFLVVSFIFGSMGRFHQTGVDK